MINVLSLDIGLSNFVCATNNVGKPPFILNGDYAKDINRDYNIQKQHMSFQERQAYYRMRNSCLKQFFRKCTKYIISFAVDNAINTIVVGKVNNWQHGFGKYIYDFDYIPIKWFIDMLKSQCKKNKIHIRFINEKFTSGTSFIDNEKVNGTYYNKSRRHSGTFHSGSGKDINGDVNDSYQIMRKAYPNIFNDGTFLTVPTIILIRSD